MTIDGVKGPGSEEEDRIMKLLLNGNGTTIDHVDALLRGTEEKAHSVADQFFTMKAKVGGAMHTTHLDAIQIKHLIKDMPPLNKDTAPDIDGYKSISEQNYDYWNKMAEEASHPAVGTFVQKAVDDCRMYCGSGCDLQLKTAEIKSLVAVSNDPAPWKEGLVADQVVSGDDMQARLEAVARNYNIRESTAKRLLEEGIYRRPRHPKISDATAIDRIRFTQNTNAWRDEAQELGDARFTRRVNGEIEGFKRNCAYNPLELHIDGKEEPAPGCGPAAFTKARIILDRYKAELLNNPSFPTRVEKTTSGACSNPAEKTTSITRAALDKLSGLFSKPAKSQAAPDETASSPKTENTPAQKLAPKIEGTIEAIAHETQRRLSLKEPSAQAPSSARKMTPEIKERAQAAVNSLIKDGMQPKQAIARVDMQVASYQSNQPLLPIHQEYFQPSAKAYDLYKFYDESWHLLEGQIPECDELIKQTRKEAKIHCSIDKIPAKVNGKVLPPLHCSYKDLSKQHEAIQKCIKLAVILETQKKLHTKKPPENPDKVVVRLVEGSMKPSHARTIVKMRNAGF